MNDETDKPLSDEEMALARRGEALIKAEAAKVQAPQSLREAIERERQRADRPTSPPLWRRLRWVSVGAAAAIVLIGVAVVLDSGGGGNSEPTLASVDAVAKSSSTEAAPAVLGGDPPVLDASVGRLQFPDWRKSFGWTAVGQRADEVGGRAVTTVFYRNGEGAQLGYSVLAGAALAERPQGREVAHEGKTYHLAAAGSRRLITWTQQGHTCVIVAPASVKPSKLVELAASRNV